jgi:DNA polymerase V
MSLQFFQPLKSRKRLPLVIQSIPAGEAAETDNAIEWVDLNEYVSNGSDCILYIRVRGDSMIDLPIFDGDLLVVDRLACPENGKIILARTQKGYTVKRYKRQNKGLFLVPANKKFTATKIRHQDNFEIIGVVTGVYHKF